MPPIRFDITVLRYREVEVKELSHAPPSLPSRKEHRGQDGFRTVLGMVMKTGLLPNAPAGNQTSAFKSVDIHLRSVLSRNNAYNLHKLKIISLMLNYLFLHYAYLSDDKMINKNYNYNTLCVLGVTFRRFKGKLFN
jgi:hypothetical protein